MEEVKERQTTERAKEQKRVKSKKRKLNRESIAPLPPPAAGPRSPQFLTRSPQGAGSGVRGDRAAGLHGRRGGSGAEGRGHFRRRSKKIKRGK